MSNDGKSFQNSGDECNVRVAMALAAAGVVGELIDRYGGVLFERVFKERFDELRRDGVQCTFMNRLRSQDAHDVLAVIWRESRFVEPRALATVGKRKIFAPAMLNKNSLSAHVCDAKKVAASDFDAIRQSITRICEAAASFGLIEYGDKEGTRVPLSGTMLLHEIMTETHYGNARFIRSLSRGSAKPQSREVKS